MRFEKVVEYHTYDRFGELLYILQRNNRKYLNDKLAEYDLNLLQSMALLIICQKENITQKDLAEFLFLTKSGMTKAITKLESSKYIKKERSKEDSRKYVLILTPKGRKILPKVIKVIQGWEEKIGLNEFDETFMENLKKLAYASIELNSQEESS